MPRLRGDGDNARCNGLFGGVPELGQPRHIVNIDKESREAYVHTSPHPDCAVHVYPRALTLLRPLFPSFSASSSPSSFSIMVVRSGSRMFYILVIPHTNTYALFLL